MKHNIPCEIIRDLFPSYVDELTSDVTNNAVKEHIKDCVECTGILNAMKTKDMDMAEEQEMEREREVDYLKKTRARTRRIAAGSVMAAVVVFFALMFVRLFMVGDPVGSEVVYCTAKVEGNVLTVESTMIDSARIPSDIIFEEEEPGVICISYRAVLCSPWNNRGTMTAEYTSKSQIKQVKAGDRIIWAGGEDILALTSAVYATRHPYVGDMPSNALPIAVLNMGSYFGGFSNELQTSEEPYGWSFVLEDDISSKRAVVKEKMMHSYAYVLLAVVENLGEVTYEYTCDGMKRKLTVTESDASAYAGYDIKACYKDILLLQKLIQKTGLDDYAFMDALQIEKAMETELSSQEIKHTGAIGNEGEIQIKIINNAEDDVFSLGLSYAAEGEWLGSQSSCRADNEYLRRGESVTFTFYPQDFEMISWEEDMEAEFEAEVGDMENNTYPVETSFKAPIKGGAVYTYILSGNMEEGYVIGQ